MSSPTRTASRPTLPAGAVALAALFVTALVTAQVTAAKVIGFGLPTELPLVGPELAFPGAVLAYALTFLATDCYTELYGKRAAQVLVNVGFVMNFLVLALVWSTIMAPGVDPEFSAAFATALGASTNIVAGSLVAYVVSQNLDVLIFHRLADATEGEYLWLRNIGSTATSQLVDTVFFVGIAFWIFPQYLDLGPDFPASVVVSLIAGQYLLKLLIALLDTPFVYLITGAVRRAEPPEVALEK